MMADFRNAVQWDPATLSVDQVEGSGAGFGARYRLITRFMGREVPLHYQTVAYSPPELVALAFDGDNVSGTDTITVSETPGGSRLTYEVEFRLKKGAFLDPLVAPIFRRIADEALRGLAQALTGSVVKS
jgi:hypothetical protein